MGEPMKKIFSRKTLIVVVIALIVALAAVISMVGTGKPGFVTSAVETLLKPVKSASAAVAGTCEKLYGYMHDYDRLIEENAALRARLAGADREARDYDALEEENVRLRELLGLSRKSEDYEYESASIIAWSASSWDSTFTINKGSANSDVSPGDPVITSSGCVVGLVRTVSASSSVCVSLIDTTFAVSVDLDNVSGSCSAVGDYALMRQGKLMVEYISDSNRVFAGDSDHFRKGRPFPRRSSGGLCGHGHRYLGRPERRCRRFPRCLPRRSSLRLRDHRLQHDGIRRRCLCWRKKSLPPRSLF